MMIKKSVIVLGVLAILCSLSIGELRAQGDIKKQPVGVGTRNPHSSAALELSASNKGLLMPKVALQSVADRNTVKDPATGLMVYNTHTAGQAPHDVVANNIYVWDGAKWVKFSSLPEIRTLKKPIHFVLASKAQQIFDAQELSDFNAKKNVLIKWLAPNAVVKNDADIVLLLDPSSDSQVKVKTAAFYEITGSINFLSKGKTYQAKYYEGPNNVVKTIESCATAVAVVLQSSTNNGSTWKDEASATLAYEQGACDRSQTIVFPAVMRYFQSNTRLRFVLRKASEEGGQLQGAGITYDPPLPSDVTKSFRISRLRNVDEY